MTKSVALDAAVDAVKRKFGARDFSGALAILGPAREQFPADQELLYLTAVACRYEKDYGAARSHLDHLLQIAPDLGRAHQELAHLARDQGRMEEALLGYRQAVDCNPGLIASWQHLQKIYTEMKLVDAATRAAEQVHFLAQLPPILLRAKQTIHEGQVAEGEALCRTVLQKDPRNIEAMRILAEVAVRLGILEDAEFLLESAVAFAPEHQAARLDYLQVLRRRQKFAMAHEQAAWLLEKAPDNLAYQAQFAVEKMQAGDHAAAVEIFDQILERAPHDPNTLTSKGHALKTLGDQAGAVESYQEACRAKPDHGDAYFSLSNLKTHSFSDEAISEMEHQLTRPELTGMNRVYFHFALASAYEQRALFDLCFQHLEAGNSLKRRQSRYQSEQMTLEIEAQIRHCTADILSVNDTAGCQAPDPIFIVGLPRAGSTLIEQILASHSQIDGTLELPNILSLAHGLRGQDRLSGQSHYPENLRDLTHDQRRAYGQQYIDDTRMHRAGAPFFTDKMPNNFRHIGLIHLILPNAKIIDARRSPLDCCFSGYKQLFAQGQEFSYGLHEIGRYYRDYVRLMAHWDTVLPGKILRVQHEDLIADLEGQVMRILDYLNLPFEESCISFHKTERAVRTASSEQVRQPINSDGVGRWRPHARQLLPMADAIGRDLLSQEDWMLITQGVR